MKIVQSLWSKPLRYVGKDTKSNIAGWPHLKYFLFSWAYSCLKFREFYDQVELVTDTQGYRLLIEELELPYTDVSLALDDMEHLNGYFWPIGKLYAYGIQQEPFIHADGDVFIWRSLGDRLKGAALIAQHKEVNFEPYTKGMQALIKNDAQLPDVLVTDHANSEYITAVNAGIIGGQDIPFLKRFSAKSIDLALANERLLANGKIHPSRFAVIYEQYLFSAMAKAENKHVEFYWDDDEVDYTKISGFQNKYSQKKFCHPMDRRKMEHTVYVELERMLRMEYPEQFNRIRIIMERYSPVFRN